MTGVSFNTSDGEFSEHSLPDVEKNLVTFALVMLDNFLDGMESFTVVKVAS